MHFFQLTRHNEGAGRGPDSIAHSALVSAVISGVQFEPELRDTLRVDRWGSNGQPIAIPAGADYSVWIGLENQASEIDCSKRLRTDIQQDWIHNRRIWWRKK